MFLPCLVRCLLISASAVYAIDEAEQLENPVYARWKQFPEGTIVEYLQVTRASDFEERRIIEYRLKEKTADQLVVEIRTRREDQKPEAATMQSQTARRLFRLPPGISKTQFGKPAGRKAEGTELLSISSRDFQTNWFIADVRVEAGTTETISWSSDSVPGGLVRSISRTPAVNSTTTLEIVRLQQPGQTAWINGSPASTPDEFVQNQKAGSKAGN